MANEKRLIELGQALRMIKNSREDCPETSIKGRAIWETAHNCALSCLTSCHTVDAVEVVHGRWILKSRIYKMFDDVDEEFYVECNLCNREEPVCFEFGEQQMLDYAKRHYPYCHCGAKMDGGNEDG